MKLGIILACHNKVDDLMIHIEALKYFKFDFKTIIIHTMDYSKQYMDLIEKFHHKRIDGFGHYIGPLLCAVEGIKKAKELGLDYAVYKNSDDIIYNDNWEKKNFDLMAKEKYLCGGYNWMNVDVFHDITLNQVYFDVNAFYDTCFDAEEYFKRSARGFLCEFKMARWVKKTCKNLKRDFYRLPGREQLPGIGWESQDIVKAFKAGGLVPPADFWTKWDKNNRYFNEEWQLIGSHDIASRLVYWKRIRKHVPYAAQLEKEPHFLRFLEAAKNNGEWNLKAKMEPPINSPVPSEKKSKIYKRKIF